MSDLSRPSFSTRSAPPGEAPPELLHELFERQVEARPTAVAVICGAQTMTYEELDRRANGLARLLRNRGIGRGDCVGLLLPRSAEVYVGMLGILKAGAAYVPLDPEYPAERVSFILSDCQARALVTTEALAARSAGSSVNRILLDGSSDSRPCH